MAKKRISRYLPLAERKRLVKAFRTEDIEPALESCMKIQRVSGVKGKRESCTAYCPYS